MHSLTKCLACSVAVVAILLTGCGKKPQPAPETGSPEAPAVEPASSDATAPETATSPAKPAEPEIYPGLEIPTPPPPKKFSRIEKSKVVWGVANKTLPEVVELLGMPSAKRPHQRDYYPESWLYEWEMVVVGPPDSAGKTVEYPKLGLLFKDRSSRVTNIYLNEYLTGTLE